MQNWDVTSNGVELSSQSRILLPQSSASVSSLCYKLDGTTETHSFNYGDLAGPVPASAFRCQEQCVSTPLHYTTITTTVSGKQTTSVNLFTVDVTKNLCSTITDQYSPHVSIPAEFSTMNQNQVEIAPGISCYFQFDAGGVFFDPPRPLIAVNTIAGVTMQNPGATTTSANPTVTAEPGTVASPTMPTQTSSPQLTNPADQTTQTPAQRETQSGMASSSVSGSQEPSTVATTLGNNVGSDPQSDILQDPSQTSVRVTTLPSATEPQGAAPNTQVSAAIPKSTTSSGGLGGIIASIMGMTGTTQPAAESAQSENTLATTVAQPLTMQSPATSEATDPSDTVQLPAVSGAAIQPSSSGDPADTTQQSDTPGVAAESINSEEPAEPADSQTTSARPTNPVSVLVSLLGDASITATRTLVTANAESQATQVPAASSAFPAGSYADGQQKPAFTAGGATFTADGTAPVVVASSIAIQPGGPAATVSGQAVSLAPSGSFVVVDGSTQSALHPPETAQAPPPGFTAAGASFAAQGTATVVIAPSVTLQPGGPPATVSGQTISLAPSASFLVVDGSTQSAQPAGNAIASPSQVGPVFSAGGESFTAQGTSPIVMASSVTLQPGGPAVTVSGQTISLAPSASFLVVDGSTQSAQAATATLLVAPVFTAARQSITAQGTSAIVVASSVPLQPGGPAVTVSGQTISLAPSASFLVVDGSTQNANATPAPGAGTTIAITQPNGAVISDISVQAGGPVTTVSGHTISLAPSASYVVVDGNTQTLAQGTSTTPVFTAAGQTYTADAASGFTIASGTILQPGHAVTISGTTISLAPSASYVVVNGATRTLAKPHTSGGSSPTSSDSWTVSTGAVSSVSSPASATTTGSAGTVVKPSRRLLDVAIGIVFAVLLPV